MISDEILSKEAYLIYKNTNGFEPVHGDLTTWEGPLFLSDGQAIMVRVLLPPTFPREPPDIQTPQPSLTHALKSNSKTLTRWRPQYHLYQVIWELQEAAKRGTLKLDPIQTREVRLASKEQETLVQQLQKQLEQLEQEYEEKKRQLQVLQTSPKRRLQEFSRENIKKMLEETQTQLEQELFALDIRQENAEIDDLSYAKKFVDLRTRLALIESQIKKL